MTEIPALIKKNVRSVLLSKQGGVLVSDFLKDYKKLIEKPLHYKDLGFETILDFIKALADAEVGRLEYCDALMAYKIYGTGDPNMYMSMSAKRAQGSKKAPVNLQLSSAASDGQDDEVSAQEEMLVPNPRGLFSLIYPKKAEDQDVTKEDVKERFSEIVEVSEVNMIERYIFVRFRTKEEALKALRRFGAELELRVAEDRNNKNDDRSNRNAQQNRSSTQKPRTENSRNRSGGNRIEIYFGNIQHSVTDEEFEELVSEFSPDRVRMQRVKGDSRKLFAFVDVSSREIGDKVIEKLDQYVWKSRKLNVRYAKETPPPKKSDSNSHDNRHNQSDQGSERPKPAWRQYSDSNRSAETKPDEDEWDLEDDPPKTSSLSEKMSELKVETQQIEVEQAAVNKSQSPASHSYNLPQHKSPEQTNQHSSKTYVNSSYTKTSPQKSPVVSASGDASSAKQYSPNNSSRGAKSPGNAGSPQQYSPYNTNRGAKSPGNAGSPQQYYEGARKSLLGSPPDRRQQNGYTTKSPKKSVPQEADDDEMPSLEPLDEMPSLEYIDRPSILYVGNFLYGSTEQDIANLFAPYDVVDVNIRNSHNKMKSTYALVTVGSMNCAQQAMADLDQRYHQQRRLLVCLAKQDPCYETPAVFTSPLEVRNIRCTIGPGGDNQRSVSIRRNGSDSNGGYGAGRSPSKSGSHSSLDTLGSDTPIVKKSFSSLLLTYQIIMKKLGGGRRDLKMRKGDSVTVFITSIYDSKHFWAQIVEDEDSLQNLEFILTTLQEPDARIGPTRGLGRCAALHENDWFRGWIIAEKKNYSVDVFFVDYGNTACCPKQTTSLTVPEIWEHKPVVRPFSIPNDMDFEMTPDMESRVAILTVQRTNIDETGLLTEVVISDMPVAEQSQ